MNTYTPTASSPRLRYLDAAKGWGICMVVFGHITSLGNPVDIWFSSYKLSIFFFVSGYLLCMRQSFRKCTVKDYIKKQIRSILVPYFGYSGIVLLYNIGVGIIKNQTFDSILKKFIYQLYTTLSLRGISALWFLPALFIGQILFILIIRAPKFLRILSAVIPLLLLHASSAFLTELKETFSSTAYSIVSFPILTISRGFLAFWFIGSGYITYLLIKHISKSHIRLILGVVLSFLNIYLSQYNPGIDFNMLGLGVHPLLTYFNGIIGPLGTLFILEFLEKSGCKMPFLNFCGKYSLIIMATHGTLGFKALLINGWRDMYHLSDTVCLRYYVECTGILLELLLIECGVIRLIENYCPWLMGNLGSQMKKNNL